MNFTILHLDAIDSTNSEALRRARAGVDEGLCVIAREQIAGRGRRDRTWTSPKDVGLYLSVVLRPKLEPEILPLITFAAAIAVYDTLLELGLRPDIKWPNDIQVAEKKICGILAETAETDKSVAVVVGIGINMLLGSVPPEFGETATSIESELGKTVTFSELERPLLDHFNVRFTRLCAAGGADAITREWSLRSSYFRDKPVRVTLSHGSVTGLTDGLESNGALRVRSADGSVTIVQAGDVEKLRTEKVSRTGP